MNLSLESTQSKLFILLLAILPLEVLFSFEINSKNFTPVKIILLLLLFLSILKLIAQGFRYSLPPGFLKISPFLLAILVFDVIATYRGIASYGINEIIEHLFYIFLVFLTLEICNRDIQIILKGLKAMCIVLVLGVVAIILYANFDFSFLSWIKFQEAKKLGNLFLPSYRTTIFPMTYGLNGMLIFSVLPFCFFSVFREGFFFKSRRMSLFVSVFLVFAVLFSNSRSTWLGFLIMLFSLLSYLVLRNNKFKKFLALFVLLFLLFIAANIEFFAAHYQDFSPDIFSMRRRAVTTRMAQYRSGLKALKKQPALGMGHGVFKETTTIHNKYIHNYFIRRAVDIGGIGGLVILGLFVLTAINFFNGISRHPRQVRGLLILCFTAAFMGMVTELMLYDGSRGLTILWIWIALAFSRFGSTASHKKNGNGVVEAQTR